MRIFLTVLSGVFFSFSLSLAETHGGLLFQGDFGMVKSDTNVYFSRATQAEQDEMLQAHLNLNLDHTLDLSNLFSVYASGRFFFLPTRDSDFSDTTLVFTQHSILSERNFFDPESGDSIPRIYAQRYDLLTPALAIEEAYLTKTISFGEDNPTSIDIDLGIQDFNSFNSGRSLFLNSLADDLFAHGPVRVMGGSLMARRNVLGFPLRAEFLFAKDVNHLDNRGMDDYGRGFRLGLKNRSANEHSLSFYYTNWSENYVNHRLLSDVDLRGIGENYFYLFRGLKNDDVDLSDTTIVKARAQFFDVSYDFGGFGFDAQYGASIWEEQLDESQESNNAQDLRRTHVSFSMYKNLSISYDQSLSVWSKIYWIKQNKSASQFANVDRFTMMNLQNYKMMSLGLSLYPSSVLIVKFAYHTHEFNEFQRSLEKFLSYDAFSSEVMVSF